jgi:hypothetical protein
VDNGFVRYARAPRVSTQKTVENRLIGRAISEALEGAGFARIRSDAERRAMCEGGM